MPESGPLASEEETWGPAEEEMEGKGKSYWVISVIVGI